MSSVEKQRRFSMFLVAVSNLRNLGISIYPQYGTEKEWIDYIEKASAYGFSRIFTCLMSAGDVQDVQRLKTILKKANDLDFEVIADVSPSVFEEKKLTYKDLSYFKELGLSGLRLDLGFSGLEESIMSFNDHGLSIELNMSQGTNILNKFFPSNRTSSNLLAVIIFTQGVTQAYRGNIFSNALRSIKKMESARQL